MVPSLLKRPLDLSADSTVKRQRIQFDSPINLAPETIRSLIISSLLLYPHFLPFPPALQASIVEQLSQTGRDILLNAMVEEEEEIAENFTRAALEKIGAKGERLEVELHRTQLALIDKDSDEEIIEESLDFTWVLHYIEKSLKKLNNKDEQKRAKLQTKVSLELQKIMEEHTVEIENPSCDDLDLMRVLYGYPRLLDLHLRSNLEDIPRFLRGYETRILKLWNSFDIERCQINMLPTVTSICRKLEGCGSNLLESTIDTFKRDLQNRED